MGLTLIEAGDGTGCLSDDESRYSVVMGESLEKGARCDVEWRWICCARDLMVLIYRGEKNCQA